MTPQSKNSLFGWLMFTTGYIGSIFSSDFRLMWIGAMATIYIFWRSSI